MQDLETSYNGPTAGINFLVSFSAEVVVVDDRGRRLVCVN